MTKNTEQIKKILTVLLVVVMVGIIFFFQTKKQGFHEDEVYMIVSSVNPYDGVVSPYGEKDNHTTLLEKYVFDKNIFIEIKNIINYELNLSDYKEEMDDLYNSEKPVWKTKENIKKAVTLQSENFLNLKSIYLNQAKDSHPPFFYTLVHFTSIIFRGQFTKYTVFLVNILAFIGSLFVISKILKILNKENLVFGTFILFGLSIGTITMVIYQRMYMALTFFILAYFYYNLKIYKNKFKTDTKDIVILGMITVLGFLTQYFFAIYAFLIFLLILIQMIRKKKYGEMPKYLGIHIIYAIIGILLFVPSIYHLFKTDRGISNLANSEYFSHFIKYIKHLLFAFTIKDNMILAIFLLVILFVGITYLIKKSSQRFEICLTIIPSIIYFFIAVKLTSFQELRYIMPVIPFVVITFILILDNILNFKYKDIAIIAISIILIANGLLFSKPKFLFEEYKVCLEIAEENKDKSFVYVYDNFFNHMQSIPEMMIYQKTMIINIRRDETKYFINSDKLNNEDSYILCIKTYMDNEEIVDEIRNNTEFKNIKQIYEGGDSSETISNNLYIVSK